MNIKSHENQKIPQWLMLMLAIACGVIVANLYFAQPLIGPISLALGISPQLSGMIVTLTQVGYGLGLLFIVPLSDLIENRKLILMTLVILLLALAAIVAVPIASIFFLASFFVGIGAVAVQILVPYAAYLSSDEQRGRAVGNVMSGLLFGIMLARPVASFITAAWSWNAVFILAAGLIVLIMVMLRKYLPKRKPVPTMTYGQLIQSLWGLFKTISILRRRAIYQAFLFSAFSLFWTVMPLWLVDAFALSQNGIALFSLAGVAGAVAAPIAGRLADRGWTRCLTGLAFILGSFAFLLTHFLQNTVFALPILVVAAIVLDMAVSGNLILGQRAIYSLGSEIRGRLNGIFMAIFFLGGAVGSAIGGWSYAHYGWFVTSMIGMSMPLIAFIYYLTESPNKK